MKSLAFAAEDQAWTGFRLRKTCVDAIRDVSKRQSAFGLERMGGVPPLGSGRSGPSCLRNRVDL